MKIRAHRLKSWSNFFQAIRRGDKRHDLRDNDRDFRIGDRVVLQEFDQTRGEYTGEELIAEVTYITSRDLPCAFSSAVLDRSYCIISLRVIHANQATKGFRDAKADLEI